MSCGVHATGGFMMTSFARRLLRRFQRPSFALNDLDRKLLRWLDRRGGFFIEAGANDGITQSNTLYFERYRGWTGLLVEPIPELAERCRRNRPGCIVENAALVARGDPRDEVSMQYCNLMSIVEGAMKSEAADREHLERGRAVQRIDTYEVKVRARTMDDVLAEHCITRVDFLSLDVEGYELEVLKGMTSVRPDYMLIEVRDRPAVEAWLKPAYDAVALLSHHDVLFRRRSR